MNGPTHDEMHEMEGGAIDAGETGEMVEIWADGEPGETTLAAAQTLKVKHIGPMHCTRAIMDWGTNHVAGPEATAAFIAQCIKRFMLGDWGDQPTGLSEGEHRDDWAANDAALENGSRILASYNIPEELRNTPADLTEAWDDESRIWINLDAEQFAPVGMMVFAFNDETGEFAEVTGIRTGNLTVMFPSDY